jgi:hypothetical protein
MLALHAWAEFQSKWLSPREWRFELASLFGQM